jgi:hypothetical protein
LLKAIEFWSSRTIMNPKLQREGWYLKDLHNMVRTCRERKDVYIPPTWLKPEQARAVASAAGVPVYGADEKLPPPVFGGTNHGA